MKFELELQQQVIRQQLQEQFLDDSFWQRIFNNYTVEISLLLLGCGASVAVFHRVSLPASPTTVSFWVYDELNSYLEIKLSQVRKSGSGHTDLFILHLEDLRHPPTQYWFIYLEGTGTTGRGQIGKGKRTVEICGKVKILKHLVCAICTFDFQLWVGHPLGWPKWIGSRGV